MLKLKIDASDTGGAPPPPDVDDPRASVWREESGEIVALGQTVDGLHWVHLPRAGAFAFPPDAGPVTAIPEPGVDAELIEDAFRRMILPLALQAQGREVLHASAVHTPAGVVALCAVSGTGKSTIAYALSRRGHRLWADDAVCFERNGSAMAALPLPYTLRLRPASAAFFAGDSPQNGNGEPDVEATLAAVFVLERGSRPKPALERVPAASAFTTVLAHGYCFNVNDRARNAAMVRNYLELVDCVPTFRITFSEGLEHVDDLVALVEEAVHA